MISGAKEPEGIDEIAAHKAALKEKKFYGKVIEHWENGAIRIIEITEVIKPKKTFNKEAGE